MTAVPRLVTVWCPDWSVTAARHADPRSDTPAAVLHANRVVARSPGAAQAGVAIGQRRRDAQRCCPELLLLDHDPVRDAREFEPVIRAVTELAPRLDVVEPGWITLAARGPSRFFGGDQALAERLAALVADLTGAPVGVGVADGRAASAIAARRATPHHPVVVPPGESPHYLAPLPVAWLREVGDAAPELVDVLVRLGVRTLGELAALPAADVLARFGRSGAHAHRLAGGGDARPAVAVDPVPERRVERVFEPPVEQVAPVVFVAKQLADQLVAGLAAEGRVCTRLLVVAETEHGERSERTWYRDSGLSAPAMVERVRWQLDGWVARPGGISAGIALVRLVPDEVRGDDGTQIGLWGGRSQADDDAARAITRLVGLAGDDAVRVPSWRGGRLPGERYEWVPAASADLEQPASRLTPGPGPWPGATPPPSPAVVPEHPVPVEMLGADGRPVRVSGRGEVSAPPARVTVDGIQRHVVAWAGPWPIDQHWWERRRHRRAARFQVVTDDGEASLLLVEHQQWWAIATYS
jgi:protein ImuB